MGYIYERANADAIRVSYVLAGLLLAAVPVYGHHSAAAEYVANTRPYNATITRFTWMNPHTWVYFDVGQTHYECEGSSPNGLIRNGWTRSTIKPGDHVTIEAWPAKDRPEGCKVRAVILPDGKRMYMGWAGEIDPESKSSLAH